MRPRPAILLGEPELRTLGVNSPSAGFGYTPTNSNCIRDIHFLVMCNSLHLASMPVNVARQINYRFLWGLPLVWP